MGTPASKKSTTSKKKGVKKRLEPAMPVPVKAGPVEPPRAYPTWWVVVLILIFASVSMGLLVMAIIHWPPSLRPVAVAPANTAANSAANTPTPNPVYSYLSVVTPVAQKDHYVGSLLAGGTFAPSVCVVDDEDVGLAPASAASTNFVLAIEHPLGPIGGAVLSEIEQFVGVINKHHLRITFDVAPDPSDLTTDQVKTDFAAWVHENHEVALYFDPAKAMEVDDPTKVPYGGWLLAMHKAQQQLQGFCNCSVTSWIGGDSYSRVLDVGKELGFTAHTGWMDATTQTIPEALAVTNPWGPTSDGSIAAYTTFDPIVPVIAVPSGVYPSNCLQKDGGLSFADQENYTTKALYETLKAATKGKVNVFRVAVGGLNGNPTGTDADIDLKAWDDWLTKVVDPLVARRILVPSTTSNVAVQFNAWLDQNIGKIELK